MKRPLDRDDEVVLVSSGSSDEGTVREEKSGDGDESVDRVVKKLRVLLRMVAVARVQLESIEQLLELDGVREGSECLESDCDRKV